MDPRWPDAPPRILVVEDNEALAAGVVHNLELEGYQVTWVEDGDAALAAEVRTQPDLIILDLMLPGIDGFEVLRRLRAAGSVAAVIILSARSHEVDKVRGFRLDADQYVTKPFGLMELLERVRSLLRRSRSARSEGEGPEAKVWRLGEVTVRPLARTVHRGQVEVSLSPKAFDLLLALALKAGQVVSRPELLREVWGYADAVVSRTIDSHISELRQAIEPDPAKPRYIQTVRKVGYRLDP